jgi:hypothetical protein
MERDARTEEFATRVTGGIEQKSQKIPDLERRNEELESKIDEAESRFRYHPVKRAS